MTVDSVEVSHYFAFWRHGTRLASFLIVPKNCIFWGASLKLIKKLEFVPRKVTRFLWNPPIPLLHPRLAAFVELFAAKLKATFLITKNFHTHKKCSHTKIMEISWLNIFPCPFTEAPTSDKTSSGRLFVCIECMFVRTHKSERVCADMCEFV